MKNYFLNFLICSLILIGANDLNAQSRDELEDLQIKIRREKLDKYLHVIMREHKVDMWIQVIRPWDQDPMKIEFGCVSGIIIFTVQE